MNLTKLLNFILITCLFVSCTTTQRNALNQRNVSSLEDDDLPNNFNALFESFFEDTDGQGEIVAPFARTSLLILKRSYYYLDRFDEELDRIHKDCISLRINDSDAECENPMDLPDYYKLQASRIVFERQKSRLAYYYKRLLDLSHLQDSSLTPFYDETTVYLRSKSEGDKNEIARVARSVVNQWNTELRDLISLSADTEGPITYELAVDLFKLKEFSHQEWAEAVGVDFKPSSILNNLPTVASDFETRSEALELEKTEGKNAEDSEDLLEVFQQLQAVTGREPQAVAWRNHTGRSFGKGEWALTYDDGPQKSTTNQILDSLQSRGWHATFFWLAQNAKSNSNSQVVKRAKSMGMGLASHSYSHADLGRSGSNLNREIKDAKSVLESVYGRRLNFFRLPYGSGTKSSRVKNMITSLNMEHFFWNVDSLDWKKGSPEQIYSRTKKQMDVQGKGILLFHDIHQRTVGVTKLLVSRLPKLKVIKLEDGAGVSSRANSGGGRTVEPPRRDKFIPHERVISASVLNVRVNGARTAACGEFHKGDRVKVSKVNHDGWFFVSSPVPRSKADTSVARCVSGGWISGSDEHSGPR